MDKTTYLYIRDSPVFSAVRSLADHGVAHQYGKVLLEGGHAPESLIGAGSAISVVQETDSGEIQIYRKKQFGLENKHGKELISEFYNVKDVKKSKEHEPEVIKEYDVDVLEIKDSEVLPPLEHNEEIPLKIETVDGFDDDDVPWKFESESLPPLRTEEKKPPLKMKAIIEVDEDVPWE